MSNHCTVGVTVHPNERALLHWYAGARGTTLSKLLFTTSARDLIQQATLAFEEAQVLAEALNSDAALAA